MDKKIVIGGPSGVRSRIVQTNRWLRLNENIEHFNNLGHNEMRKISWKFYYNEIMSLWIHKDIIKDLEGKIKDLEDEAENSEKLLNFEVKEFSNFEDIIKPSTI